MKLINIYYSFFYDNFKKELFKNMKEKDNVELLSLLNQKSSPFLFKKFINNANNLDLMYAYLPLLINQLDINCIKKLYQLGLNPNKSQNNIFQTLIQSSKYHANYSGAGIEIFKLLLDAGLNINEPSLNKENILISPIQQLLEEMKSTRTSHFPIKSLPKKGQDNYFNDDSTINYQVFKIMLKQGIKFKNQEEEKNLICLALFTKNENVLNALIDLPNLTVEYFQKGINEYQAKNKASGNQNNLYLMSDDMIEKFKIKLEQKILVSHLSGDKEIQDKPLKAKNKI